jgi:hypothetical protein
MRWWHFQLSKKNFLVIQRPYREVTTATCSLECHKRPSLSSWPSLPRACLAATYQRRGHVECVRFRRFCVFKKLFCMARGRGLCSPHGTWMAVVPPATPHDLAPLVQTPPPTKPPDSDTFLVCWGNFLGEFRAEGIAGLWQEIT